MKNLFAKVDTYILAGVLLSCSVSYSYAQTQQATKPQALTAEMAEDSNETIPMEDVQRFTNAITQIKTFYVKPVDNKEMFDNAIRGMVSSLDPHSDYLNPEAYQELKSTTSGEFGGLGIEIDMQDDLIRVVSPLDGTPADKAGIESGDLIYLINKTPVKGLKLTDAVKLMRGEKGSKVTLGVIRKGETKPLLFTMKRDVIQVKSVKNQLLEPGYGYVRITNFQEHTADDLRSAIKKLDQDSNGSLRGMVLDLRNNPGGLLDSAVDVSDVFISNKGKPKFNNLIVYTNGRLPGSKFEAKVRDGDLLNGKPLVVLINGGSASGSEIVAGALQDHKRAVVVGEKSFGKGSVQTVLPLDDDHAIKITTALYYTPAGRSIQATGISPDIEIKNVAVSDTDPNAAFSTLMLSESELKGHLANGNKTQAKAGNVKDNDEPQATATSLSATDPAAANKTDDKRPLVNKDFQLYEALNILKGLTVSKS